MSGGGGLQDLTARETAVLSAVERRLGNTDIADELHISVRTVESHIASLRRKLAADTRAKLIDAARARRGTAVPVPQNSFVGRTDDVGAVRDLLTRERFVTVVGPAGCGKTRLALELAAADDRVPLVAELEHATQDDVVGVVAKAVGMGTDGRSDLVGTTALALDAQRYLLVLDNCDRVTAQVARLVDDLLALAGSLRVLATCRSPVGGTAETVYPLAPLQVAAGDHGAVRLFLDRARSAAPTATAGDHDEDLLVRICSRLDGLPLALELAAARVRHLSLPELASRLDEGFGALGGAGPTGRRHRTLESAFEWTWDLLDRDEQSVLRRLAALPRTFDLALAEAVSAPGTAGVVLRLLDRSLLSQAAKPSNPTRFRLLESLRAFVLERTDPETVQEVRLVHARYYESLAFAFRDRARSDDSRSAAEQAKLLCPEINAALDWALSAHPALALSLARTLSVGGEQYGPDIGSLRSIARTARDPAVRAVASPEDLLDLGVALCYDDLDLVAELAALSLERAAQEPALQLPAHHLAGQAAAYRHDAETALAHLEVAERLADERLDMWQLAHARQIRGIALRDLGRFDAAMEAFESAMHTFSLAGDAMHVNNARYMMAANAVRAGRPVDQAVALAEQCAAYATGSGNKHEQAHALLTRATLIPRTAAEADLNQVVGVFRAVGDLRCLARSYLRLADGRSPADRATLLQEALEVATRARDIDHQAMALEQLVCAYWETGAHQEAAASFGALSLLVGDEEAEARCPDAMVQARDLWAGAVAQGRARGVTSVIGASRTRR